MYALAHRERYQRIQIYYGAKTPHELMYLPNLRAWEQASGVECHLTVDRGAEDWTGHVGVVGSRVSAVAGDARRNDLVIMAGASWHLRTAPPAP